MFLINTAKSIIFALQVQGMYVPVKFGLKFNYVAI